MREIQEEGYKSYNKKYLSQFTIVSRYHYYCFGCNNRLNMSPEDKFNSVITEMKKILEEITSGQFADEWIAESESGRANFNALRKAGADHPIEKTGKELRSMMPWISAGRKSVAETSGGAQD
jgi:hypothetical protein